jgi:aspartate aminotransferase-like enzyme
VHRGVHLLSEEATQFYENVRKIVQQFINASSSNEIIFVRGATEGINLVAQSYGRNFLKPGDEVLITGLEHHANIVPWQLLRDQIGIILKVAPVNELGEVILERFYSMITQRTKVVAISHVSNAIGTINPIIEMVAAAKQAGAISLIDGCQAAPHLPIDVQRIDCDFYTFSSHKVMGPTGIGILYGRTLAEKWAKQNVDELVCLLLIWLLDLVRLHHQALVIHALPKHYCETLYQWREKLDLYKIYVIFQELYKIRASLSRVSSMNVRSMLESIFIALL